MPKKFVSPISIDLGAKNTGVYFAHYPEGSSLKRLKKNAKGVVYQLEKDKYTLLMKSRTQFRHQKRGYDRRQMVKRLFKLIWCEYFKLNWDKDIQQAISFLLNRRGFTFLTEEYDKEQLKEFPKEAFNLLPEELKKELEEDNGSYDFDSKLREWSEKNQEKIKKMFECLNKKPKEIRRRLNFITQIKALKKHCSSNNNKGKKNKKEWKVPSYILEECKEKGIKNLPSSSDDVITHLDSLSEDKKTEIKNKIEEVYKEEFNEEPKIKKDDWNFNPSKFDLEKANFNKNKTHLHHLCFALYKIKEEFASGARYRSKYFEEIKKVLKEEIEKVLKNEKHQHKYLKRFCGKLHKKEYGELDTTKLFHLIAHLSNLELKPLRKYFNNKEHKKSNQWLAKKLSEIFHYWILKQWRVSVVDGEEKKKDYKELRKLWKEHEGTKEGKKGEKDVVSFWIKTDPKLTIPPYQDNNNRRPPKCQSLILNSKFLDEKYPQWDEWLKELKDSEDLKEYLKGYEEELKGLKSRKGKSYFNNETEVSSKNSAKTRTNKDLKVRILQFIFDRVKDSDPLNLNEIFSHAKKYKQKQSTSIEKKEAKNKLEKAIEQSKLPKNLKTPRNYDETNSIFEKQSFLYLTYKYYKLRQKAKEGRIFIHPKYKFIKGRGYENTGHFNDKNHLLSYCNHKPRQKKHQTLYDLAGLLQVSPKHLESITQSKKDEDLKDWLKKEGKVSKSHCEKASKAQKDLRGSLKIKIQDIYRIKNQKTTRKQKKLSAHKENQELSTEDNDLFNLCDKFKIMDIEDLYDEKSKPIRQKDIEEKPYKAVYFLAQLHNLMFKERHGNANTCVVCSADNAERMNVIKGKAKAQRLSAISTRLIDGAVMRMARIVTKAIAEDKWEVIKQELEKGNKIHIPIVTESNRFEFEPSLRNLKGKNQEDKKSKKKKPESSEDLFNEKNERIKKASGGYCPYEGSELGDTGEIDHIIPRASEYGTLNDEANLIYVSKTGHDKKGTSEYSLDNLNNEYKKKQFTTTDKEEIISFIEKQIWDESNKTFTFGKYYSFINLTFDQQKAFRHALFLPKDHHLRKKVIEAIDHRLKSLVNGTQRYFAEVLANNIYKKAKLIKKENQLSFDFFGIESQSNSKEQGIYYLRKFYETHPKTAKMLKDYKKQKGKSQTPYSHLIDAQLAFCIALDAHKKEGSFKLDIDESVRLWPKINTNKNGKEKASSNGDKTLFHNTQIPPEQLKETKLERDLPSPEKGKWSHRPLFNQNAVAMHFLKLIQIDLKDEPEPIYLKGFLCLKTMKDCITNYNKSEEGNFLKSYENYAKKIPANKIEKLKKLYVETFSIKNKEQTGTVLIQDYSNQKARVTVYSLNKKLVYNFLIDNFNSSTIPPFSQENLSILEELQGLWYFTKRKEVIKEENNQLKFNKQEEKNFKCAGFINPQLKFAWDGLESKVNSNATDDNIKRKVQDYFLMNKNSETLNNHPHKKVRKTFSLPIKTEKGFLIRKKNWEGESIFYCRPASNNFSQTVLHLDDKSCLSNLYRKSNIFYVSKKLEEDLKPIRDDSAIDSNEYYEAKIPEQFKKYISKIENKRTDKDRPQFKFHLLEKSRFTFEDFKKFIEKYPFRKIQDVNSDLKTQHFNPIKQVEELKNKIKELEGEVKELEGEVKEKQGEIKKLNKVLTSLKEFKDLWYKSQNQSILEFQAKAHFTTQ